MVTTALLSLQRDDWLFKEAHRDYIKLKSKTITKKKKKISDFATLRCAIQSLWELLQVVSV